MFVLYTNIMKINNFTKSNYKATFHSIRNIENIPNLQVPKTNTEQIVKIDFVPEQLPKVLPNKFELTEAEEKYNAVWVKLKLLNLNILTQKSMLKDYYSTQDRLDYKALLRQRQTLLRQLKKIASDVGIPKIILEIVITAKKEYNRYAPKIIRAKTIEDIETAKKVIQSTELSKGAHKLLDMLFKQQKNILKI